MQPAAHGFVARDGTHLHARVRSERLAACVLNPLTSQFVRGCCRRISLTVSDVGALSMAAHAHADTIPYRTDRALPYATVLERSGLHAEAEPISQAAMQLQRS
jgi:hypothetical protein